jgi:hypothetical protein
MGAAFYFGKESHAQSLFMMWRSVFFISWACGIGLSNSKENNPMATELLKPVLVIVVGYLLRLALVALGVELDEPTFNAIVLAIVAYLLALVGVEGARRAAPKTFK